MTQSAFAPPDLVSTLLEAETMAFKELKKASSDTASKICSTTFRLCPAGGSNPVSTGERLPSRLSSGCTVQRGKSPPS